MSYKKKSQKLDSLDSELRQKMIIMPKVFDADGDLSKKWYVYFSYRDPVTGKMKRFRPTTGINHHTKGTDRMEAAKKLSRRYYDRLRNGWSPFDNTEVVYEDSLEYQAASETYGRLKKNNQKLLILISEYLDSKRPPVFKDKTFRTYQSKFRIFAAWLRRKDIGNIHPSLFTEELAEKFFRFLLDKRKSTPPTHNKYRAVMKSFFEYAKKKKKVRRNPIDCIPYMRETEKVPIIYNDKMQKSITGHLGRHDKQLLVVVKFIYYTFIRPGELRLMKIRDLNFWEGTAIVRSDISKNRREQRVTLPDVLVHELEDMGWADMNPDFYLFSKQQVPGNSIVGQNYFASRYRKQMNLLRIPKEYELYSWKHTGASIALQTVGVDLESLRKQLRHSDLKDTQRYASAVVGQTSIFKTNYKEI